MTFLVYSDPSKTVYSDPPNHFVRITINRFRRITINQERHWRSRLYVFPHFNFCHNRKNSFWLFRDGRDLWEVLIMMPKSLNLLHALPFIELVYCFHYFYQKELFVLTWFILSFRVWVAKSYSNPKLSSPHFSLGSPWSKYMSTKEMLRFCQNASCGKKNEEI